jgi:hypothetical protein
LRGGGGKEKEKSKGKKSDGEEVEHRKEKKGGVRRLGKWFLDLTAGQTATLGRGPWEEQSPTEFATMIIIVVGMMKTIVLFSTAPSYCNLSWSFPSSTSLCWCTFHLLLGPGLSSIPLLFLLDL